MSTPRQNERISKLHHGMLALQLAINRNSVGSNFFLIKGQNVYAYVLREYQALKYKYYPLVTLFFLGQEPNVSGVKPI
jgi:hypothetical protein